MEQVSSQILNVTPRFIDELSGAQVLARAQENMS